MSHNCSLLCTVRVDLHIGVDFFLCFPVPPAAFSHTVVVRGSAAKCLDEKLCACQPGGVWRRTFVMCCRDKSRRCQSPRWVVALHWPETDDISCLLANWHALVDGSAHSMCHLDSCYTQLQRCGSFWVWGVSSLLWSCYQLPLPLLCMHICFDPHFNVCGHVVPKFFSMIRPSFCCEDRKVSLMEEGGNNVNESTFSPVLFHFTGFLSEWAATGNLAAGNL